MVRVVSELLGRHRERAELDRAISGLGKGRSAALVIRGEAGIGKSVLLDYAADQGAGHCVTRATGVESEMELAYAGLQQLCGRFLGRLDALPVPQREALKVAFGLATGPPPDDFLVAMATLSLFADAVDEGPVVCLVDDAQWLDRVSARALGFVGRRLDMEGVALVVAVREPSPSLGTEFSGIPELVLGGLDDVHARKLLDSVIMGPIDERVRSRIIAETHGNPLALLELPKAWTAAEMAEGLWRADADSLHGRFEPGSARRLEQGFARRLESLLDDVVLLLLLAAAEPLGDPTLLWGAAERLGIGPRATAVAQTSGLIDFSPRVRFRHPLVRSVVYRSAWEQDRRAVHAALADVTDPDLDPDRRAWHRAEATSGLDEQVASELERRAEQARARGGRAAAASFTARAASLTPDPALRADRLLAAAVGKYSAGALNESLALLGAIAAGPPSDLRTAEVEALRGRIAFDQRRTGEAARLLFHAAELLRPLNQQRARRTYLDAFFAALLSSGPNPSSTEINVARAAQTARFPTESGQPLDILHEALALRFSQAFVAAEPLMRKALEAVRDMPTDPKDDWQWLAGTRGAGLIALELWDIDSAIALATRYVRLSRRAGALVLLQYALNYLGSTCLLTGDLNGARETIDEDRLISQAIGFTPVGYVEPSYLALRGREAEATRAIDDLARGAAAFGHGRMLDNASFCRGVLYNGLGRPEEALESLAPVFERDVVGYYAFFIPELAEAAARADNRPILDAVVAWLAERTALTPTEWLLGIDARVRALASDSAAAEALHRESLDRLRRTRLRIQVGRGRLLYGEWLRRHGRRADARQQLRAAYDTLTTMGLDAFAERARLELLATGSTVRSRADREPSSLTAQESMIARLAGDGLSNIEIGQRLFLSPRTIEWHLSRIFSKLGIASRRELLGAKLGA
jgi:DNA-binding CsgD family transcriptional regulator